MINKRISKLVALLLAMIMLFNIAPLTVFAEIVSDLDKAPDLPKLELGDSWDAQWAQKQGNIEYTVQYYLKGEYTYDGKGYLLSDYTEKNRTYPDCIEVRKILLDGDLDLAIYESLIRTIKHCESEGKVAHPRQLEVLKEYEERIKNR